MMSEECDYVTIHRKWGDTNPLHYTYRRVEATDGTYFDNIIRTKKEKKTSVVSAYD